jgi:hypothetical protein
VRELPDDGCGVQATEPSRGQGSSSSSSSSPLLLSSLELSDTQQVYKL